MTSEAGIRLIADGERAYEVSAHSETGTVRQRNEDRWSACQLDGGGLALLIADGMGGAPGGAEAADAAVEAAGGALKAAGTTAPSLRLGVDAAIAGVARVRASMGGTPGTTLDIALMRGSTLTLGHVGDSRAYLLRDSQLQLMTTDHSWVAAEVAAGRLNPDQARHDPRRNIITRAIMGDLVEPDLFQLAPLEIGDVLVLCTDGVWEPLDDEALARLWASSDPLDAVVRLSCQAALEAGSRDNVTVVAARRVR